MGSALIPHKSLDLWISVLSVTPDPCPALPSTKGRTFEGLQWELPSLSFTRISLIATITLKAGLCLRINFSNFSQPLSLALVAEGNSMSARRCWRCQVAAECSSGCRDKSRDKLWVPGAPSSPSPSSPGPGTVGIPAALPATENIAH